MLRILFALLLTAVLGTNAVGQETDEEKIKSRAGNPQVAEVMRSFQGRGVQSDGSQPTAPEEALKSFQLKEGYSIDLVASEPEISQPLFLSWDSRGRMWVVQYRQYQYQAGLKVLRYDHHLRAVFDKVPPPPPNHFPGKDRITVYSDTDGDGLYDSHKDVITGLNIVSSLAVGRGGIWVLNPPYLLFYPDADRDDVPDGEPEVHLSGFGIQDTHSVANSLMWGPDGWLYGANGSTTGGTVSSQKTTGITFQGQCIWRYHPQSKEFEIWAEGGGNTFSLDIDSKGRVFCGTNGGKTRGWYLPQGSYSRKNWGKHGPLTNPYAFGFFEAMKFEGDGRRFPQAFLIYEGGLFPKESFDGAIVAPNAMQNLVWHSKRIPQGSTYRTEDLPNLLECSDRWFRPVYAGVGPDGGIYVADWYDTRLSHVSPTDDWHKESGRVYRIRPSARQPKYSFGDLHESSPSKLVSLLNHENKWVRRRATLELGWANPPESTLQDLMDLVQEKNSLEALWAINMLGELNSELAGRWLSHGDSHIRRWCVRLLGDRHEAHPRLVELARTETDVQVRSQLAATARRIAPQVGLSVVRNLLRHGEDDKDLHQPLMCWWAIEQHAGAWSEIEKVLRDQGIWNEEIFKSTVAGRLMRRYAATASKKDLERCIALLALAPDLDSRARLIKGFNQAFQGRTLPPLPKTLADSLKEYQEGLGESGLALAIRQGDTSIFSPAVKKLRDTKTDAGLRIELAKALGDVAAGEAESALLELAIGQGASEPALQRVALQALASFENDRIAETLALRFDNSISAEHGLRDTACRTLASRGNWAKILLKQINGWRIRPTDIPADVVQRLRAFQDDEIAAATSNAFGAPEPISSPEKVEEIRRLKTLLSQDHASDLQHGEELFRKRCANCHRLFGEGQSIAPELDAYDRKNLDFWLPAVIAPSLEIREGYQSYAALTEDGRIVTGMIAAQNVQSVTLRNAENNLIVLQRDELVELKAIRTSLMPQDLLKDMNDQDIRDLFVYLM
ncbi:MAG: PVC-type heme-binding CxxCH protein, partial [Planctomycetota bacterium]